jgi:uroporphyrinogen decarboxylase
MAEMTRRERIMTALRRGVPDRVPCSPSLVRWSRYHCGCVCPYHQLKVSDDFGFDTIVNYGMYIWRSVSNDYMYAAGGGYNYNASGLYGDLPNVKVELRIENQAEHVWYYRTFHTPGGDLHDVIQWARPNMGYGDGPNPHRVEPLVKSLKDLDAVKYLYPEPRRDMIADIPLLLAEIGERAVVAAYDTTHVGGWGMEPLGPENMLLASIENPELLKGVCRLAQDAHLRNLRRMLEQGMQVVYDSWFQVGPSVGWSPATYKQIFLPLIKEAIDLAHEFGAVYIYQDDGKMRGIIPHLVEAGVDVISGMQPPQVGDVILKDVKARYGQRVALLGGLDPVYTFDMGTPDLVRAAVRQAIADAGPGGGYIISTAEACSPETPRESLQAAAQAVKDFGVYGRDL